jgi:hypothetical protein
MSRPGPPKTKGCRLDFDGRVFQGVNLHQGEPSALQAFSTLESNVFPPPPVHPQASARAADALDTLLEENNPAFRQANGFHADLLTFMTKFSTIERYRTGSVHILFSDHFDAGCDCIHGIEENCIL